MPNVKFGATKTMTAVLSPSTSSPSSSPHHNSANSPTSNLSSLPPLVTNHPQRRSVLQRPPSYASKRMSSYSTTSNTSNSQRPSRPVSNIFSPYHSSLSYTQVRDFAYPTSYPLHYGPPAESSAAASGQSTPAAFEFSRKDILSSSWDGQRPSWERGGEAGEHLPQVAYGGTREDHGPPYSEDEDLQSPVVVSSRHKKPKGHATKNSKNYDPDRGVFAGVNGDGSETYYVGEDDAMAGGPGGELVTYPPDQARHSNSVLHAQSYPWSGDRRNFSGDSGRGLGVGGFNTDESRFSRDYQFTIASPDEEMHGKAVALFDFHRENENELPLVEGQVIWVSYRQAQGWLVAEDPKTRESGLVPEEYVRLLRDIEGDWQSLSADPMDYTITESAAETEPANADTPTETPGHKSKDSTGSNGEKRKPVVSTFSTSSKDLDLVPQALLGKESGQQPPQVVHYGSQQNTPTTLTSSHLSRKDSNSVKRTDSKQKKKEKKAKS